MQTRALQNLRKSSEEQRQAQESKSNAVCGRFPSIVTGATKGLIENTD